jgi:thiol:disulfide interchange protein DsbC
MKSLPIAALSLLLLSACAGVSGEPTSTAPQAAPALASKSIEDVVRQHVAAKVPGKVSSVRKLPFGMYEVVIENEIVYVDESAEYLITGHLYNTKTQEDLTAKRSDEVLRVDFSSLPLQLAFKVVRGDGSRPIAIFEDPNCPYCKKLEREIRTLNNTTMYVFLYPILSDDSVAKSTEIWCSKDPANAWASLMLDGRQPDKAAEGCKTPIDDVLALGHRLAVTGTPTLLFADGKRAPGMIPLDRIEQMMNTAAAGPQSKQPGPQAKQN